MQTTCESPLPGPFAAAADPAATALWAARARIEDARGVVLELQVSPLWVRGPTVFCPMARLTAPASSCPLQDSARALQSQLTAASPAPPATLAALRASVLRLRVALAERLGLRSFDEQSGGGAEPDAPPLPPGSVDDDAVLLVVSLPKGKRLLARAVPMLLPVDRVSAVTAGLRQLPHFAASENVGAVSRPSLCLRRLPPSPPTPLSCLPSAGGRGGGRGPVRCTGQVGGLCTAQPRYRGCSPRGHRAWGLRRRRHCDGRTRDAAARPVRGMAR